MIIQDKENYFSPDFTIHDNYLVGIEKLETRIVVSTLDRELNDYSIWVDKSLDPIIVTTGMVFPVGLGSLSCYPVPGDYFPEAFIESEEMHNYEDGLLTYNRVRFRLLMSINTWDGSYLFFLVSSEARASLGTIAFITGRGTT